MLVKSLASVTEVDSLKRITVYASRRLAAAFVTASRAVQNACKAEYTEPSRLLDVFAMRTVVGVSRSGRRSAPDMDDDLVYLVSVEVDMCCATTLTYQ